MSARTRRTKQLTPEQLAAIEQTHRLLDEIARDFRTRQHATALRKGEK